MFHFKDEMELVASKKLQSSVPNDRLRQEMADSVLIIFISGDRR